MKIKGRAGQFNLSPRYFNLSSGQSDCPPKLRADRRPLLKLISRVNSAIYLAGMVETHSTQRRAVGQ